MKKGLLPFLMILLALLYIASNIFIQSKKREEKAISVFSQSPYGLSILNDFASRIPDAQQVKTRRTAFLTPDVESDTLLIQSPKRELSDHELETISELVRDQGKTLILSFHDEKSHSKVKKLLTEFGISAPVSMDVSFENSKWIPASPPYSFGLFQTGVQYAFYGRMKFDDDQCDANTFWCYVREASADKGKILAISSLSLLSNSLIVKAENFEFAESILFSPQEFVIDEYHNFFTDLTLWDLLSLPEMFFPILGFVGLMIVYALFGYHREDVIPQPKPHLGEGIHKVNSELLSGLLPTAGHVSDGITLQAAALQRHFPDKHQEIEKILQSQNEPVTRSHRLLKLHRESLFEKGHKAL